MAERQSIEVKALSAANLTDYLAFFDTRAFPDNPRWASCYCFFPYHDPKTMDWPKRSAAENRLAITASVTQGQAQGYLAYAGDEVVGWCNAAPRPRFPMLDEPEPDAEHIGSIMCFVVAPSHRGRGVATALLGAACDGLKAQGLRKVQAKPVKDAKGSAANHWGPLAMYLAAGFTIVREDDEGDVFVEKSLP
jgi:ribosomal protein S18 acetylase RimI-like enzyme